MSIRKPKKPKSLVSSPSSSPSSSGYLQLPPEILLQIFKEFLRGIIDKNHNPKDLILLQIVCKQWYCLIEVAIVEELVIPYDWEPDRKTIEYPFILSLPPSPSSYSSVFAKFVCHSILSNKYNNDDYYYLDAHFLFTPKNKPCIYKLQQSHKYFSHPTISFGARRGYRIACFRIGKLTQWGEWMVPIKGECDDLRGNSKIEMIYTRGEPEVFEIVGVKVALQYLECE
ncbi:12510_t:CDS:2 [Ambispora leptoticha]|uniref:12510_t:CDS:1 n=1 Tax=Ambispora leptoticha TaxID=144679 RepID=A0A9N9B3A8_9GLOM|nr:12510_t:CDS:2 [Ambispora leptoticha]